MRTRAALLHLTEEAFVVLPANFGIKFGPKARALLSCLLGLADTALFSKPNSAFLQLLLTLDSG